MKNLTLKGKLIYLENEGFYLDANTEGENEPGLKRNVVQAITEFAITQKAGNFSDFKDIDNTDGEKCLMGEDVTIPNCNLRIYFTGNSCTLDEAIESMDRFIYGGEYNSRTTFQGYSEYSIETLNLKKFTIGGHNLNDELTSHLGQYCFFILEV